MNNKFFRTQLALGVSAAAVLAAGQFALTQAKSGSQANKIAADPAPDAAATTPGGTAGGTTLQGGIQHITLSLERLRDVGLDLKAVLKAADGLYDEVTIQPVTLITEPEVVGRGIIINIPIGTQPAGPVAPARKDRVDLAMNNMRPIIEKMKSNVDAVVSGSAHIDLPADIQERLKPQFKTWVTDVNETASDLENLEKLTAVTPPYDQPSIAQYAQSIQVNVKDLDKTRREIYKVIRKEGKRIEQESHTSS